MTLIYFIIYQDNSKAQSQPAKYVFAPCHFLINAKTDPNIRKQGGSRTLEAQVQCKSKVKRYSMPRGSTRTYRGCVVTSVKWGERSEGNEDITGRNVKKRRSILSLLPFIPESLKGSGPRTLANSTPLGSFALLTAYPLQIWMVESCKTREILEYDKCIR